MASKTGMDYKKTYVDWASYCREKAVEYLYRDVLKQENTPPIQLSKDIEVDESCFGSRSKHNRGVKRGMKVWIVGLAERSTNKIIMHPADNRNAITLSTIIQRSNVYMVRI